MISLGYFSTKCFVKDERKNINQEIKLMEKLFIKAGKIISDYKFHFLQNTFIFVPGYLPKFVKLTGNLLRHSKVSKPWTGSAAHSWMK